MEPIISPWAIYWINTLSAIGNAANWFWIVIAAIGIIGIVWLAYADTELDWDDNMIAKFIKWWFAPLAIGLILDILLAIFIPNIETMYTMFALKYITPDNIELGVDGLKSIVDYIIQSITALTGGTP